MSETFKYFQYTVYLYNDFKQNKQLFALVNNNNTLIKVLLSNRNI